MLTASATRSERTPAERRGSRCCGRLESPFLREIKSGFSSSKNFTFSVRQHRRRGEGVRRPREHHPVHELRESAETIDSDYNPIICILFIFEIRYLQPRDHATLGASILSELAQPKLEPWDLEDAQASLAVRFCLFSRDFNRNCFMWAVLVEGGI